MFTQNLSLTKLQKIPAVQRQPISCGIALQADEEILNGWGFRVRGGKKNGYEFFYQELLLDNIKSFVTYVLLQAYT
jgi:hypothetical protein